MNTKINIFVHHIKLAILNIPSSSFNRRSITKYLKFKRNGDFFIYLEIPHLLSFRLCQYTVRKLSSKDTE